MQQRGVQRKRAMRIQIACQETSLEAATERSERSRVRVEVEHVLRGAILRRDEGPKSEDSGVSPSPSVPSSHVHAYTSLSCPNVIAEVHLTLLAAEESVQNARSRGMTFAPSRSRDKTKSSNVLHTLRIFHDDTLQTLSFTRGQYHLYATEGVR